MRVHGRTKIAGAHHFDAVNRANRDANIAAMTLSFIYLPGVEFLGIVAHGGAV